MVGEEGREQDKERRRMTRSGIKKEDSIERKEKRKECVVILGDGSRTIQRSEMCQK